MIVVPIPKLLRCARSPDCAKLLRLRGACPDWGLIANEDIVVVPQRLGSTVDDDDDDVGNMASSCPGLGSNCKRR